MSELLYSFRTKSKLETHKRVCENKDFGDVFMSSEDNKVLEFNQYQNSYKALFIIENIDEWKSNLENSSTTKVSEHIPSSFSMPTISSFKSIQNKHDVYWGKDCMKKFYESLKKHAIKKINFIKKKMKLFTKEQQESYEN